MAARKKHKPSWKENVEQRTDFNDYRCLVCGGPARELTDDVPHILDRCFHRITLEDFEAQVRARFKDKTSCFLAPKCGVVVCGDTKAAQAYDREQARLR